MELTSTGLTKINADEKLSDHIKEVKLATFNREPWIFKDDGDKLGLRSLSSNANERGCGSDHVPIMVKFALPKR